MRGVLDEPALLGRVSGMSEQAAAWSHPRLVELRKHASSWTGNAQSYGFET